MMRNDELLSIIGIGLIGFGLILFLMIITMIPEV